MPAITSLESDSPFPSAVRTSTSFAFGAAPGWSAEPPAATPATIVPCPCWSPVAPGASEETLTLATTREPKSAVFVASMPLSMIAIVGACGRGPVPGRHGQLLQVRRLPPHLGVLVAGRAQRRVGRDRADPAPLRQSQDLLAGQRRRHAVDGAELPAQLRRARREGGPDRRHRVADGSRVRASPALHDHAERRVGLCRRGVEQALRDGRAARARRSGRARTSRRRPQTRRHRQREDEGSLKGDASVRRTHSAAQPCCVLHSSHLHPAPQARSPDRTQESQQLTQEPQHTSQVTGGSGAHSSPFWGTG